MKGSTLTLLLLGLASVIIAMVILSFRQYEWVSSVNYYRIDSDRCVIVVEAHFWPGLITVNGLGVIKGYSGTFFCYGIGSIYTDPIYDLAGDDLVGNISLEPDKKIVISVRNKTDGLKIWLNGKYRYNEITASSLPGIEHNPVWERARIQKMKNN